MNQVRSHEDYMVIGCVCKYGDVFSLAVLIDRGLDQQAENGSKKNPGQGLTGCVGTCMVQAYLDDIAKR